MWQAEPLFDWSGVEYKTWTKIFKCIIYADETTLLPNLIDLKKENSYEMLNTEPSEISVWFQLETLSLDTTIAKFIFFTKPQILKIIVIKTNKNAQNTLKPLIFSE